MPLAVSFNGKATPAVSFHEKAEWKRKGDQIDSALHETSRCIAYAVRDEGRGGEGG